MKQFKSVFESEKEVLISYVMVGDGGFKASLDYARFLIESGVDILELGMPFSDPAADGGTILRAGLRALEHGTKLEHVFEMAREIRRFSQIPLVIMSYLNPLYQYGFEKVCGQMKAHGIEGIIIPDLPFEAGENYRQMAEQNEVKIINLVALTTSESRLEQIASASDGFIYLVAVKGITGTQVPDLEEVEQMSKRIKQYTDTPVVAGFGIRTQEDVKAFNKEVDGVVIASRFIELREAGKVAEIKKIIGI